MVDVEYSPIKKIVVHEIIKYGLDDFIRLKTPVMPPNVQAVPCRWIDGIVFDFASAPLTPELVNEQIRDNKIHWGFIEFAEMPKFQQTLVNPDTGITRHVINGANNTAVQDVIKWLKKQPQWSSGTAA